ncbi:hypothetical protein [Streptomyces hygroscopicus]|uniref:hypothetical protein n=1 Tax=Streptomyces hygroscopicus TaxID=1912 RepID=UPI0036872427
MNIGKTAALVTAAASAVVFGGANAGALGLDTSVRQTNDCDTSNATSIGAPPAQSNCLNFAEIFGEHSLAQRNDCDSSSGVTSTGNVIITAPATMGSRCANIAVSAKPSKSGAAKRGAHGGGNR